MGAGKQAIDPALLLPALLELRADPRKWVVVLSRGGHFAAAVFNCQPAGERHSKKDPPHFEVVAHKTFHRYVVRCGGCSWILQ